ncbi:MAG: hypothetical protein ACXWCP_16705 [Burkholderiales bacterium]
MSERIKGRSEGCGQGQRKKGQEAGISNVEMLRVNSDESAVKWVFHRGADSRWTWQKTSASQGVVAQSGSSYASYCDCVNDAKSQGYKEWLPPAKLTLLSFSHVPELFQKAQERSESAARKQKTAQDDAHASDRSSTNRGEDSAVVSLLTPWTT